jgi:hypothetical protein
MPPKAKATGKGRGSGQGTGKLGKGSGQLGKGKFGKDKFMELGKGKFREFMEHASGKGKDVEVGKGKLVSMVTNKTFHLSFVVSSTGMVGSVIVKPNNTLNEVKEFIRDKYGFPVTAQTLHNDQWKLYGNHWLWYYSITPQSTCLLTVADMMPLVVSRGQSHGIWTGHLLLVCVSRSDVVLHLKTKIHDKIGFPIDQQHLTYMGEVLHDAVPLLNYGITEFSRVTMTVN